MATTKKKQDDYRTPAFTELAKNETDKHHKAIFELLGKREATEGYTADGAPRGELTLDAAELETIKDELYGCVLDSRADQCCTLDEMKDGLRIHIKDKIDAIKNNAALTKDGYFNTVSGIGTTIDPGMATQTFCPVSLTPQEVTGYYVSGGIPQRIIDKKAGCLTLNGVKFNCAAFTPDDLTKLEEYAEKVGFNQAYRDVVSQALQYGGACTYPVLYGDSPMNTEDSMQKILDRMPEKDFIRWWVTADRWSIVFVPDYNITAKDYLFARTIFVPLGGVRVNTQRVAMVRPKKLPFWGAIQQLGWATSDFEGWIRDFEAWQIIKAAIPIMAQQMSLMYHHIPADGLILENGPEYAREFFKENEKQMREWSILHPKALNSVGEIKILERTYSGFQQLVAESRLALAADAGLAESVVFQDKPSGLASDREEDVTLKQSEVIRNLFNCVAPSMQPCIKLLVYSCFGKNSDQAKHAGEVSLEPDSGVVLSDQDKASLGQNFSTIAAQLVSIGLPVPTAMKLAQKFVPSAEFDQEMMNDLDQVAEGQQGFDGNMWGEIQQNLGPQGMEGMGGMQ